MVHIPHLWLEKLVNMWLWVKTGENRLWIPFGEDHLLQGFLRDYRGEEGPHIGPIAKIYFPDYMSYRFVVGDHEVESKRRTNNQTRNIGVSSHSSLMPSYLAEPPLAAQSTWCFYYH